MPKIFVAKPEAPLQVASNLKQAMTKFYSLLTAGAIALVAIAPQASAQSIVRQYKDELDSKLGKKTNGAASKVVARVIKKYLRREPGKAVAFARIGNLFLKKSVKNNLRGEAALTLLKATARGFIGANGELDKTFNRFVRLVIRKLPGSEKNAAVLQPIADALIQVNRSRGGNVAQDQFIADLVFGAGNQAPPVVS